MPNSLTYTMQTMNVVYSTVLFVLMCDAIQLTIILEYSPYCIHVNSKFMYCNGDGRKITKMHTEKHL